MPFSVQLGLALALACSVVASLGFLFKQKGAAGAPAVEWRRPVKSTVALFSNKWWTLGILVAMAAWGLHVAALALAPISLVQSVIAGGLALLTVIADRVFGLKVSRREWIGVVVTAVGLALLAATLGDTGQVRARRLGAGRADALLRRADDRAASSRCSSSAATRGHAGPVLGARRRPAVGGERRVHQGAQRRGCADLGGARAAAPARAGHPAAVASSASSCPRARCSSVRRSR